MYNLTYNGYTIIVRSIKRDWSETAVEYSVNGTNIVDECEEHLVMKFASRDIDKL